MITTNAYDNKTLNSHHDPLVAPKKYARPPQSNNCNVPVKLNVNKTTFTLKDKPAGLCK